MKLDKLSKRDFFKMLGGGAAAGAMVVNADATMQEKSFEAVQDSLHVPHDGRRSRQTDPLVFDCRPYMMDLQPHILYGRFTGEAINSGYYDPFAYRVGEFRADGKRLTFQDTNMTKGSELPMPCSMGVGGIMMTLDRSVPDDVAAEFERNVRVSFKLCAKEYFHSPASRITQRGDFEKLVQRDGDPTNFVTSKMFRFDNPHMILVQMAFGVTLIPDPSYQCPSIIDGYVYLDGVIARGVQ